MSFTLLRYLILILNICNSTISASSLDGTSFYTIGLVYANLLASAFGRTPKFECGRRSSLFIDFQKPPA